MTRRALGCALAAMLGVATPTVALAGILPVTNGLVLNFQADNIDGANNATLVDGQEIAQWNDVVLAGGDPNANDAAHPGVKSYLDPANANTLTPNYVAATATGGPGLQFTRVTGANGDALGSNVAVNGLMDNNSFTAFVVGTFVAPGPQRSFQMGRRNGANKEVVGLANTGYRFNGASKVTNVVAANQILIPGPTIATYSMDLAAPIGVDGVNATYRLNGADIALENSPNAGDSLVLANFNHGFAIGAGQLSNVADSANGVYYAVIVYNRVLSNTEVQQVEAYLSGHFVPEPSSFALAALGAVIAAGCGLRRKFAQA